MREIPVGDPRGRFFNLFQGTERVGDGKITYARHDRQRQHSDAHNRVLGVLANAVNIAVERHANCDHNVGVLDMQS